MYTIKNKRNFRTLSGILAFTMLILPAAAYARGGRSGGGDGERAASSNRAEMSASAERSAGSGRMEFAPSRSFAEPQRSAGFSAFRNSEGFSGREFSSPAMRFDGGNRFERGFSARPQATFSDNRPMNENFNNRSWARTESTVERGTPPGSERLSPSSIARAGSTISPQTATVERPSNGDIGTWRHASPQFSNESQRPIANNRTAVTGAAATHATAATGDMRAAPLSVASRTQINQWPHNNGRFATFGRDMHAQSAPAWNRDNVSLRVVNNVTAQRNTFFRGTSDFFHRDGHRFIDIPRNDFAFFGRHHNFIHHRIIDRDFFFVGFFDFGPWWTYCPVYPYYHLGYVFVNPCGYWPYDYNYLRYYQYGCYPYYWYGYNPVPYEYGNDTYNYYTYNYYGTDTTGPASGSAVNNMSAYKPQQPAPETSADQYFDAGVKAFSAGDFKTALAKFALASKTVTDDKVLPFAYSQAFLAMGDYKAAAQVLRAAVAKVNPATEGVFYPRGLYSSDDILLKQIDELGAQAAKNAQDTDLQLLLGYQYLGMGEFDKAEAPLKAASLDSMNGPTAQALLQLLDKLQTTQTQTQTQPQTPPAETPQESE